MSKIINEITLHNGYVEIIVKKTGIASYKNAVLIDTEDLKLLKHKIRITIGGHAYTTGVPSILVSHLVLGYQSNKTTIVEYINGNTLDIRKSNLRIVNKNEIITNKHSSEKNNTGIIGLVQNNNGKYTYYKAIIHRKGQKQITKHFNITKLGKERAYIEAKKWLSKKRNQFLVNEFI